MLRVVVLSDWGEGSPSKVLSTLEQDFIKDLSVFCSVLSTLTSLPVPDAEKHPHSMMLPPRFTIGMVLARWWAVPGFLLTWCLSSILFHQTKESCISWSESPLGAFWQTSTLSTVGPYLDVCVFPNHIQSIELTTGGLNQLVETSRMINGTRMHLSSISSHIAKGLNTYSRKFTYT
jgi:hypothetical protein